MRVSTEQIFRSGVESMQRGQNALNFTGMQLSTGKRILTAADDPSGATQSAQFREIIKSVKQYQRNIELAQPNLQQEEWAIAGVTDHLQQVRELVIQGANDSQTNETRGYIAGEIREIRDAIYDLTNTQNANSEYLFSGSKSLITPFRADEDGRVSYVGAEGEGSVREVAISALRKVSIGDNGAEVFMDIRENDGRVSADIMRNNNNADPRGDLVIEKTQVSDLQTFLEGTNATDYFEISFLDNAGTIQYQIERFSPDGASQGLEVGPTDYSSGSTVEFAGRSLVLSGEPLQPNGGAAADPNYVVTSRAAEHVSLFQTLDAIATAFETPSTNDSSRADLTNAVNRALADIDASFVNLSEVRSTIGTRLQDLEDQDNLNANRLLDLESTLSEIEDLDYAEAISRFTFEQTALEAAQRSYVQINRLSLFNFL
jgi:flagellar hook-associated protein 3 FlgL